MLLAYITGFGEKNDQLELCLIPDKPDSLARPVPIRSLFPNTAGVVRIGPDEAVNINIDPEGAMVVSGVAPATIYLTPNLPMSPGFRARRIKLVSSEKGYSTYYDRDKGNWDEWIANKER